MPLAAPTAQPDSAVARASARRPFSPFVETERRYPDAFRISDFRFEISDDSLTYFALAIAFAVALIIASEVMVAWLVASTPLTLCLAMIFFGVSLMAE